MAKVEVKKGEVGIFMIDGFVPAYKYYMDNRKKLQNISTLMFKVINRYPATAELSENKLLRFFEDLVRYYRLETCRQKYNIKDFSRPHNCSEYMFTTNQNWHSIENVVYKSFFAKRLPILGKELAKDQQEGLHNYAQNIIVYAADCSVYEKCSLGWVKPLNFYIKPKSEYINYNSFVKAWKAILLE